jgi:soluble P-type ATPase
MAKAGIRIDIPGFGVREIRAIASDFTGTLAFDGKLTKGVKKRFKNLAGKLDIYVLTADTFGTARSELAGLPVKRIVKLKGEAHDEQKRDFVQKLGARHVAVFGNGNNDRLQLKAVKDGGGLAVAVDNGEGCAVDAILNAHLFVTGINHGLDLLLHADRCKATLRF